jgi:hypothetical protein
VPDIILGTLPHRVGLETVGLVGGVFRRMWALFWTKRATFACVRGLLESGLSDCMHFLALALMGGPHVTCFGQSMT